MGFFSKVFKPFKKVHKVVTTPARAFAKATTRPLRKQLGKAFDASFGKLIPKPPEVPRAPPPPAAAPTFARAAGSPSRGGISQPVAGLSLITSGGTGSFTPRARTKKRTLIGGA